MDGVAVFVVTFRRDTSLRAVLESVAAQTLRPDVVLVVDNASSSATAAVCADRTLGIDVRYVAAANGGPAGGTSLAMGILLDDPAPPAWILRIDDDRPLPGADFLAVHVARAEELLSADDRTGIVGRDGAVWDRRRTRLRPRPVTSGAVAVDYVRTGHYPLYRTDMVREVGAFRAELFFGVTEVEYGLRVQAAGWRQWAVGDDVAPTGAGAPLDDWRRYYSIRNTTVVLSEHGHRVAAWRQGILRGIVRPLVALPRGPRAAWDGLRLGARALRDAHRGRLGLVVDPAAWQAKRGSADDEMPPT